MSAPRPRSEPAITAEEYARLAAFRYALRAFLHFSEEAAAHVGLTGQHYQALLILRACPAGQRLTINDLAQQLFLKHNSTVALVDRLEADGLAVRAPSSVDRRKVELRITPHGSRVIARLAVRHRRKLQMIGPGLEAFFRDLGRGDAVARPAPVRPARRRTAVAQ